MKTVIQILLSIFFAIAIGTHIFDIINKDGQPLWKHGIYFATYIICWWLLFVNKKITLPIYLLSAVFPFATHAVYAYRHIINHDQHFAEIGICILTCVMLTLGFFWKNKQINTEI